MNDMESFEKLNIFAHGIKVAMQMNTVKNHLSAMIVKSNRSEITEEDHMELRNVLDNARNSLTLVLDVLPEMYNEFIGITTLVSDELYVIALRKIMSMSSFLTTFNINEHVSNDILSFGSALTSISMAI